MTAIGVPALTGLHIAWATFCALAFVLWPTLAKYSGGHGAWINTLILVWSTITGVAFSMPHMLTQPLPSLKVVIFMAAAGLINGAAVYMYAIRTADPAVPTGQFIVVTTILMVVFGAICGAIINGDVFSARQWAGLALALASILLITL